MESDSCRVRNGVRLEGMITQLHPAHPLIWRAGGHLQVGLNDPVVFHDPTACQEDLLVALQSGARERDLHEVIAQHGERDETLAHLLARLGDRVQHAPVALGLHRMWAVRPQHTLAEHGRLLQALDTATVAVIGDSPMSTQLLLVLAASGVRRLVHAPDPSEPRCESRPPEWHMRGAPSPASSPPIDDLVSSVYECEVRRADPTGADLCVICGYGPPHPAQWVPLLRHDQPHLSMWSTSTGAVVVGPLVVPGHTGCLGCVHQHARDHHVDWALMCDQLWRRPRLAATATDIAQASAIAAEVVLRALTAEQPQLPTVFDRRVQVQGGSYRLFEHRPHPQCLCRDAAALSAPRESATAAPPDRPNARHKSDAACAAPA